MRKIGLGLRRSRGGEPREGRMVNGTQAQVVPKGTIRSVMKSHRRLLLGLDDTAAREANHVRIREEQETPVAGMPERWTRERGVQELADIDARARRGVDG